MQRGTFRLVMGSVSGGPALTVTHVKGCVPELAIYDVVVIGGGPAGLAAGLYAGRARLSTLVLERGVPGGQASTTYRVENYPGFTDGVLGPELMQQMERQAGAFGAVIETLDVDKLQLAGGQFIIRGGEESRSARTVIVATGTEPAKLGVPGEVEFRGRGVSYCATCDGAFFKAREIAVVGGGDSAIEEAIFLTRFASRVNVIHRRDQLRATRVLQERAFGNPKVNFLWNSVVVEILGENRVRSLLIKNVKTGELRELPVDGVFIYVGTRPNTAFLEDILKLDPNGYIVTDERMRTEVPGLFAAGDVRKKELRQIVTAVADGAIAAVEAGRFIDSMS